MKRRLLPLYHPTQKYDAQRIHVDSDTQNISCIIFPNFVSWMLKVYNNLIWEGGVPQNKRCHYEIVQNDSP